MNLSYEEYLKLIPEETKIFVRKTLQYLYTYEFKKKKVKVAGCDAIYSAGETVCTASALLGACCDLEIKAKLQNKGFNVDKISFNADELEKLTALQEKETFEKHSNLFLTFKDKSKYTTQNIFSILKKANSLDGSYDFMRNLEYLGIDQSIKQYIEKADNELKKQSEIKLAEELYKDLPIATVNYLETASKIRTILRENFYSNSLSESDFIKDDDSYLVPLSLFFAIFENDSKDKENIIKYFKDKGITKDAIRRLVKIPDSNEIAKRNPNMECISHLYKKYYTGQEPIQDLTFNNKAAVQRKQISIIDIIKKLLDRKETNNISIDKILEKLGVEKASLSNIDREIPAFTLMQKEKEEMEYSKNFYAGLNVETKEFINYATKIYQLLLEKMKEGKHNSDILSCEDDANTLAVYIAAAFYDTNIGKFYTGHGVTLEKVLKLLNISITKEEIDKVKLNSKITIDRFKRFVTSGVNTNKKTDTITINDVTRNLCNREFNKSTIMENIFEEIRRDINLPEDFTSLLNQYFLDQEKERKEKLTKEFFLNKSNEYYNFFETACTVFNTLKDRSVYDYHGEEENIIMSLIYTVLYTKTEDSYIYEYLGLNKDKIEKYYGLNIITYIKSKNDIDIDTIINKLAPFVEEKEGKIKLKIFDKEHRNLKVARFLGKYNLSYESFDNIEEVKKKIEKEKEDKLLEEQKGKDFRLLTSPAENIITESTKIFEKLSLKKTDVISKLDEKELENISLFLGMLKVINNSYCNKKYRITYESVLQLLGYDELELNEDFNYDIFKTRFRKYCKNDTSSTIDENTISKIVFSKDSKIIRNVIESHNVDYEVYKTEYINNKDYLETLSIPERKAYLEKVSTPELDVTSATSIMNYGCALATHTSYINDRYPSMMSTAQKNSDTESIQSLVEKVYRKKDISQKKSSWFERMFTIEETPVEEFEIDSYALSELKIKISKQIAPLYEDIKTFESLAEYMEVYRQKNLEYLAKVNSILEIYTSKYSELSEDDIIKRFKLDTYVKALESKRDSFILTEQLIKNYIYSIYILIQGDLITITGLEMSRDTLLPLVGAGKLIGNGIDNQRIGIKANKYIMNLLTNVVSKNNIGMQQNLEELKELGIPDDKLIQISKDVNKYIKQISSSQSMNTPILEKLPLQIPEDNNTQKKYTM